MSQELLALITVTALLIASLLGNIAQAYGARELRQINADLTRRLSAFIPLDRDGDGRPGGSWKRT